MYTRNSRLLLYCVIHYVDCTLPDYLFNIILPDYYIQLYINAHASACYRVFMKTLFLPIISSRTYNNQDMTQLRSFRHIRVVLIGSIPTPTNRTHTYTDLYYDMFS